MRNNVIISTPSITLYDDNGDRCDVRTYPSPTPPNMEHSDPQISPTETNQQMDESVHNETGHDGVSMSPLDKSDTSLTSQATEQETDSDSATNSGRTTIIAIASAESLDDKVNDSHLATKAAKQIFKVTGMSEMLKEFDSTRHAIKSGSVTPRLYKEKCRTLLATLHMKVLLLKQEIKEKIKQFETEHFHQQGTLPTIKDYPKLR